MKRFFPKIILLSVLLFCISGCSLSPICYDAQDWGSPTVAVSSNPQQSYTTKGGYQTANWSKSGYYLNGKEIFFVVKNQYYYIQHMQNKGTPENYYTNINNYSGEGSEAYRMGWAYMFADISKSVVDGTMSDLGMCKFCTAKTAHGPCSVFESGGQLTCNQCAPRNAVMNPCGGTSCGTTLQENMPAANNPCFLAQGLGLYMAITPNNSISANQSIVGQPVHMGTAADFSTVNTGFTSGGAVAAGLAMDAPKSCTDGEMCGVNFKILDKYYEDNMGGYQVQLLNGVINGNPGIITKIVAFVQSSLCWARDEIFYNLVSNSDFQNYVRVLLLLYIVIFGVSFLMGLTQISQKDLMIRVMKIAIIVQLISPNSWEFFNDNFFMFFTQGIGEITGMLFGGGQENVSASGVNHLIGSSMSEGTSFGCPCNNLNLSGFEQFDKVLGELFSSATQAKLKSLIRWKILPGFLYYIIINCIFILLIYVLVKCVIVYLMAYLALSLIIVLAPIFIPFLLFDFTKELFANWLKFLISYFIQPIIVLTFMFFVFQIIMNQLYSMVGYSVCDEKWWEIDFGFGMKITNYYWTAQTGDAGELKEIPVPNFHFSCSTTIEGCTNNVFSERCDCQACEPYQCTADRYVKYPYLDPNTDTDRLKELEDNELMKFTDILLLCFTIWFMLKFADLVPDIAKDVAGTPMSQVSLEQAATGMRGGLISAAKNTAYFAGNVANAGFKRATGVDVNKAVRMRITAFKKSKAGKVLKTINPRAWSAKGYQKAKSGAGAVEGMVTGLATGKTQLKYGAKAAGYVAGKVTDQIPGMKTAKQAVKSANNARKQASISLRDKVNNARESVGGMIDSVYHAPKRALSQKLHDKTYGLVGKDHGSGGEYWAQAAEQHSVNMGKFKTGGKAGKAYDNYFRHATRSQMPNDSATAGDLVGGRAAAAPPARATAGRRGAGGRGGTGGRPHTSSSYVQPGDRGGPQGPEASPRRRR